MPFRHSNSLTDAIKCKGIFLLFLIFFSCSLLREYLRGVSLASS